MLVVRQVAANIAIALGGFRYLKVEPLSHWSGPRPFTTIRNKQFVSDNGNNWSRTFPTLVRPNAGLGLEQ